MRRFDCFRVEGKGAATITEVVFHTESVPKGESDVSARERELEAEKEFLHKQKKELESELSVLKKQWDLLDGFAQTASKGAVSNLCYHCQLSSYTSTPFYGPNI